MPPRKTLKPASAGAEHRLRSGNRLDGAIRSFRTDHQLSSQLGRVEGRRDDRSVFIGARDCGVFGSQLAAEQFVHRLSAQSGRPPVPRTGRP